MISAEKKDIIMVNLATYVGSNKGGLLRALIATTAVLTGVAVYGI